MTRQEPTWLSRQDLDRVLKVLEECERAPNLPGFRMAALEAMARHLGYRHSTFFIGSTQESCFSDRTAVVHGTAERMVAAYAEQYRRDDVFAQAQALQMLSARGVLSLDQMTMPARPNLRRYLEDFLFRSGIHAKLVFRLGSRPGCVGLMGVMHPESGAFGPRDIELARVMAPHLGNLLVWHLGDDALGVPFTSGLTQRQTDVVKLVACGLSNQEIAQELYVGVDTVKKHITQALKVTGSQNRTQLAVNWKAEHARRSRGS